MRRILFAMFCLLANHVSVGAQSSATVKTAEDVTCRVTFYSNSIVRVEKFMKESVQQKPVVIMQPGTINVVQNENAKRLTMASDGLIVTVDKQSGTVSFSRKGQQLISEKNFSMQQRTDGTDKGRYQVSQTWQLTKDEALYGVGTVQDGKLNRRGTEIRIEQSNLQDFHNTVQSTRGWGIYWDNYSLSDFKDNASGMTFSSEVAEGVDYYFLYGGSFDGVVGRMRELTGRAPMSPLWTYGFWQCRERYKSSKELLDVVAKYRELQVPLDGIIQDWQYWGNNYLWNAMEFCNPDFSDAQQMIDSVHHQNAHLMISIWQSFGPQTKQFRELKEKGLLLPIETWPQSGLSHIWPPRTDYPSGVQVYDAFSAEARDIYWNNLRRIYDMDVDAWWMDSTDPDFFNPRESDYDYQTTMGSWRSQRNLFPLMCAKGVAEHQKAVPQNKKRVFIMSRSHYAGQQRYNGTFWSGDVASTWDMLRKQVPLGLNFSASGQASFNTDIGGFFCNAYNRTSGDGTAPQNPQYQELYVRWMQYALFSPIFRSHGADAPREIYQFGKKGEPVYDAIERCIRLRYQLIPYFYSVAWQVHQGDASYLRPLSADFLGDKRTWSMADEFLCGQSLLAAPVLAPQFTEEKILKLTDMSGWDANTSRADAVEWPKVDFSGQHTITKYLPKGADWYNYFSEQRYDGGKSVTLSVGLSDIPMFVRAGTILPIGPVTQWTDIHSWNDLELRVYPGRDATFTLYEDEGDGYGYEQGQCSQIKMTWNDRQRTLTIHERKGSFPGMLAQRQFRIRLAGQSDVKTINYTGQEQKTSL